ncbi:MAG: DUF669 domain-containing protein [Victivallales bacterium]|nr:DUF669 domain-containing protein [Victivallales bacterium]
MVQIDFNAHEVDPSSGFDPIPAGKYLAMITQSEQKPAKNGTGEYIELVFQILASGPDLTSEDYKGRLLWERLNIFNANTTAVEIARRDLSAICHAVEVYTPVDTAELHNLPLVITVSCKKRDDNGEMSNEITKYEARPKPQAEEPEEELKPSPWGNNEPANQ